MLAIVVWSLLVIAVLNVAVFLVTLAVAEFRPRTKILDPPLLLVPLAVSAFVASFIGGLCGLGLITMSDEGASARVILIAITAILIAFAVLSTAAILRAAWLSVRRSRLSKRLLPTEEVLTLIRAGQVASFSKEKGILTLILKPDPAEKEWQCIRLADPQDYAAFVAAANGVYDQIGAIPYFNDTAKNDPAGPGGRWITPEAAAAILDAGKIQSFTYGAPKPSFIALDHQSEMTFLGTPTGIQLIDYGWVRHIYVLPSMESTMIPIARAARTAQHRLGKPAFNINGPDEQQ